MISRTCFGPDGVWGLAPPPRVDGHDAKDIVCVGLELQDGAGGAAHRHLKEEIIVQCLCPQDVASCPRNLGELYGDAVALLGIGLLDAGYIRSWRAADKSDIRQIDTKIKRCFIVLNKRRVSKFHPVTDLSSLQSPHCWGHWKHYPWPLTAWCTQCLVRGSWLSPSLCSRWSG